MINSQRHTKEVIISSEPSEKMDSLESMLQEELNNFESGVNSFHEDYKEFKEITVKRFAMLEHTTDKLGNQTQTMSLQVIKALDQISDHWDELKLFESQVANRLIELKEEHERSLIALSKQTKLMSDDLIDNSKMWSHQYEFNKRALIAIVLLAIGVIIRFLVH